MVTTLCCHRIKALMIFFISSALPGAVCSLVRSFLIDAKIFMVVCMMNVFSRISTSTHHFCLALTIMLSCYHFAIMLSFAFWDWRWVKEKGWRETLTLVRTIYVWTFGKSRNKHQINDHYQVQQIVKHGDWIKCHIKS